MLGNHWYTFIKSHRENFQTEDVLPRIQSSNTAALPHWSSGQAYTQEPVMGSYRGTDPLAIEGQPKHQQWHIEQHGHSPTASLWRATSQKSAYETIVDMCLLCDHTCIENTYIYIFYYLYSSFGMNKTVTACKTWKNIIYIKVLDKILLQTML